MTLALAACALRLVRPSFAVRFLALLAAGVFILALPWTTPLHTIVYLLPEFENLHLHEPKRILVVFSFAVALLAGMALSAWRRGPVVPALLIGLAVLDLFTVAPIQMDRLGLNVDPESYYRPSGAVTFIESQQTTGPVRYFGYDPALRSLRQGQQLLYVRYWREPRATALVVTNRATLFGLQDVQGFNPMQPARYVDYVTALNGHPQEYHGTNVFAAGLDSPLLDLLGAHYAIVPATVPPGRPDLFHLSQQWPTVYRDAQVRVVENPEALPRAWLVHEARQVTRGEALPLLASGAVDPRQIALLEDTPPMLSQPSDSTHDEVTITHSEPDRMVARTTSEAPSLLVLSESYDPNWQAYVDGEQVDLYVADHALRAVPVPAGEHEVELRYESVTLRTGLLFSGGTALLFGALLATAAWRHRRVTKVPAATASSAQSDFP